MSSDPQLKQRHVGFTMITFQPSSEQNVRKVFNIFHLHPVDNFNCSLSAVLQIYAAESIKVNTVENLTCYSLPGGGEEEGGT